MPTPPWPNPRRRPRRRPAAASRARPRRRPTRSTPLPAAPPPDRAMPDEAAWARPDAMADGMAPAAAAIVLAGKRMDQLGWVPATAGNLSVRLAGAQVAITRSGVHKGFLEVSGVIQVDLDGRP